MIRFLALLTVTLVLRAMGVAGVAVMDSWLVCVRGGLAAMFLLTASAHWGKRRPDLIRMVPAAFPRPDLIVTITGLLEVLGALGLLLPTTAGAAAASLDAFATHASSSFRSCAVCQRSSRSFARHFCNTRSSAGGAIVATDGAGRSMIAAITLAAVDPPNAFFPLSIS